MKGGLACAIPVSKGGEAVAPAHAPHHDRAGGDHPAGTDRPSLEPVLRLFLALWPDPATTRSLAAWRDAFVWPAGAAVVPTEHLHLTLHFIGAVPAMRLAELTAGLRVPVAPFKLQLDQTEIWPRGLATIGVQQVPAELLALHAALGEALRRLGLPVEQRPFRPHVTLARKARAAAPPVPMPPLPWAVAGYSLVRSAQGYRRLVDYGGAGPSVSR